MVHQIDLFSEFQHIIPQSLYISLIGLLMHV